MDAIVNGVKYRLYFRYGKTNLADVNGTGRDKHGRKIPKSKLKKNERIATTAILGKLAGQDINGHNKYIDLARSTTILKEGERFAKEEGRKQSLTKLSLEIGHAPTSNVSDECSVAIDELSKVYNARKKIKPMRQRLTNAQIQELIIKGRAAKNKVNG